MRIEKVFPTKTGAVKYIIKNIKLLSRQSKELDSIGIRLVQRPDK